MACYLENAISNLKSQNHMKLFKTTLTCLFLSLILFSCKSAYVHKNFSEKTSNHSKIAVLPFIVVTTGNLPIHISQDRIKQIQEEESILFQTSLINQLLKKDAQRKNKNIGVEILSKEATNSILRNHGISISEIANTNPSKLAEILNVDAVVLSNVQKQRYMSDLTSAGIEIGENILNKAGINLGLGIENKTKDIFVTCNIINKEDQSTIFSLSKTVEVNWKSRNTVTIIDHVNRKIVRNFPYLK